MHAVELATLIQSAKSSGAGYVGLCPSHDDQRASFSFKDGNRGVLVKCHAGCSTEQICEALQLKPSDLFFDAPMRHAPPAVPHIDTTYAYCDEQGDLLYEVVRFAPKDFRQRRPDGVGGWAWNLQGVRRVCYALPKLLAHPMVFIAEGEKDVDRLWSLGLPATCNSGGAGKWADELTGQLVAAGIETVVILPDHDASGRAHADTVARSCHTAGLTVKIVILPDLPPKGDVSDWLDREGTVEQLNALVEATQELTADQLQERDADMQESPLPQEPPSGTFTPIPAPELLDEPETAITEWIWDDFLIPGGLAALVAKPKVGKTTIAYELVVKVAQGLPYLGRATKAGGVLILALEEHRREVKQRLRHLGAEQLDNIYIHIGPLDDSPDSLHTLQTYIVAHDIVLVVFDTLNTFWSVENENDAVPVTNAIKPILALARESGAAILLLHHARKSEGEFGDEIRGSGALFSLLDVALILKRHELETQRKLTAVSRYPDTPSELIIELREHGHEALGDPAAVGKAARTTKILAALTDTLTPVSEIATRAGVPRLAAYPILNHLTEQGRAHRSGAGKRKDPYLFASIVSYSAPRGGGPNNTNRALPPTQPEPSSPGELVLFGGTILDPNKNTKRAEDHGLVLFGGTRGQTIRIGGADPASTSGIPVTAVTDPPSPSEIPATYATSTPEEATDAILDD